jgi:hypothetical protein
LQSECIVLKERKLNIAPAIKKQVSDSYVCHMLTVAPRKWQCQANCLFSFHCSHSTEHMKLHHLPPFRTTPSFIRMVSHTLSTMEWHISLPHLPSMLLLAPSPQRETLLACTRVSIVCFLD